MSLSKDILRLAGPSILANITVPLVGMVDLAVAGHIGAGGGGGLALGGASAATLISGIAVGTMLFDLLYWNFSFLRAGTAGLAAQAYGRWRSARIHPSPDNPYAGGGEIAGILQRSLRIAVLSGLILIALQWAVVWLAFRVVDCSPEVQMLATRYFYIRIWAAPATLSLFAFKGWFIGLQDTVRPMLADLIVNGVNIVLSILLALGIPGVFPGMGFVGIALGTVTAQFAGFTYCILAARRRYAQLLPRPLFNLLPTKSLFLIHLRNSTPVPTPDKDAANASGAGSYAPVETARYWVGDTDLVLRSMGMIAVYIGFTLISARYGDMMLAVSAILMKLLLFFSYFTDGFAYAGEALTGRFIGEGSIPGVRATVRVTFAWSAAVVGLFFLAYGLGGTMLLRLMSADPAVVQAGQPFLPWLLLMPLIGCPAFVWDGIFIGATATKSLRNSTLLCAMGFFAAWFAGKWFAGGGNIAPEIAIHILLGAYFVHLAIRAAYLTFRYRPAVLKHQDR
ncbi:MAG: MATE family efflux transporter [Bacteroidales bacterium]|nr:MATE family efflux transporter [Bacteroidales bacterium]